MRKFVFAFIILFSYQKINAQTDESIIRELISEFQACVSSFGDTLFLKKEITKTFFRDDSISFVKKTGLEISQKTLEEIMYNSKKIIQENTWKEDKLNSKVVRISGTNDTTLTDRKPYIKCLSEKQLDSVSKYAPTLDVYSISKLIFSNDEQSAVFHFSRGKAGTGFFSFETVLIHEVFGKWIIIRRFDWGMS